MGGDEGAEALVNRVEQDQLQPRVPKPTTPETFQEALSELTASCAAVRHAGKYELRVHLRCVALPPGAASGSSVQGLTSPLSRGPLTLYK